ncbi:MAG: pyruvate kinase [Ardenticatenaceae bacterium]|nr:pyruvate kinase [Ardenticatenaceae bacterium]MCB8986740.1 pyruvate kinase [Ardenticatenaceae bacterium]
MSRTKIVATIGPASSNPETIRQMLVAGMTVARVNFSHGDHASHRRTVKMLRQVAEAEGKVLAILGDLQGPKLRLGHVKAGGIELSLGDEVVLTPHRGQPAMIHLPHPDLIEAIQPGGRLVIGDGEIELVVVEKKSDTLRCTVTVAGLLESRKGVNAPGTDLPISSITDKDKEDLALICELMLDYVALSFVRSAQDVEELRSLMGTYGAQIPIIAKIEKVEAIADLEAIRDAADGMMVARGDLGIEVPPQEVPMLQKQIIRCCNDVGKPVITATQMLQSMIEHPRPTRAEASDVANAILDGTDAVMLSGETATGQFPVEAVLMMKQIGEITEKEFPYNEWRVRRQRTAKTSVTRAISTASCEIAEQIQARAIVCSTMSGYTATQIARHRPPISIMAVSPSPATQRQLALVWGVNCWRVDDVEDTDDLIEQTIAVLRPFGLESGDTVVITAGVPFGAKGQTNLIQIHEIS